MACTPTPAAPAPEPIHLPPLVELAPAAGLDMLVDAQPRAILAHPELLPLLALVIPDVQFRAFAARHGQVDPRQFEDLVVATYQDTTLVLALGDFDPAKVEAAFADGLNVTRSIDLHGASSVSSIVRLESPSEHLALALFGRRAVGLETHAVQGRAGPLRVSELFAMKRLVRAKPALESAPLDVAARAIGDAPVRIFFPGPFDGDAGKGLAGLLKAATAAAVAIRLALPADGNPAFDVTVSLFGAWNDDAEHAGQRFAAAIENIARSDLGRLTGLHEPIRGPDLTVSPTILTVSTRIDARKLAQGARAATSGQIDEIMKQ